MIGLNDKGTQAIEILLAAKNAATLEIAVATNRAIEAVQTAALQPK